MKTLVLKQSSSKRFSTSQKNEIILHSYRVQGKEDWKKSSTYFFKRATTNCRDHYMNCLHTRIINDPCNHEENGFFLQAIDKIEKN
jgi:hypothetical protein